MNGPGGAALRVDRYAICSEWCARASSDSAREGIVGSTNMEGNEDEIAECFAYGNERATKSRRVKHQKWAAI